jgi:hypothetical protein
MAVSRLALLSSWSVPLVAGLALAVTLAPAAAQRPGVRDADHDGVQRGVAGGTYRPFDEQLAVAARVGRGAYVGVEHPRPDTARFKFLRAGGQMVWVDVDTRTARVVGVQ